MTKRMHSRLPRSSMSAITMWSLLLLFLLPRCTDDIKTPADHVNPFIGTDAGGHTFPGACLPFGMVQLSPDNGYQGVKAYHYAGTEILGFSHTHLSGTGPFTKTHYNNILIMPRTGDLEIMPGVHKELNDQANARVRDQLEGMSGADRQAWYSLAAIDRKARQEAMLHTAKLELIDENNMAEDGYRYSGAYSGYESEYNHAQEEASPGYYAVQLSDYGVKAELTATERVGFHRYTFPKTDDAHIIIDVTHSLTPGRPSYVHILNDRQIEGYVQGDMEGNYDLPLTCYFFAEFSKPFQSAGTWQGDRIYENTNECMGKEGVGAFVRFNTQQSEQVLVKVGISFTGIDGAKKNLQAELPHWDFDKTRVEAKAAWNDKFLKIAIKGGNEAQKTVFYTAMYHHLMFPRTFSDVDGSYYSHFDDTVYVNPDSPYYVDFSLWDTYRAQHPLLAYLEPDRQNEMIRSLLLMYDQGGRLPLHVSYKNHYQAVMIGDHATSVIVDSYRKGLRDYDVQKAYAAMRKNAMEPGERSCSRYGLDYYKSLHYLPAEKVRESVSVTLEQTYDDWCLAEMAAALGRHEDREMFLTRAGYYRNLYDAETGFFRPRKLDGSWLEVCNALPVILSDDGHPYYSCFDPLWVGVSPNRHYTESSAWQYLWHVPHDVQGLIDLMGGREAFVHRLDSLFAMSPRESGEQQYAPLRSKIGQYVHGNEPVHHVAYLYNYAQEPWKTQKWVSEVRHRMYGTGPDGLCGNDDMGQMSAWYIFSALGFYPVAPGQNVFAIGTPLFEEARVQFDEYYGNRTFTVRAPGVSDKNIYIQSAALNGEPYDKSWITHDDIVRGGELVFAMGAIPNPQWGSAPQSAPPSMSRIK